VELTIEVQTDVVEEEIRIPLVPVDTGLVIDGGKAGLQPGADAKPFGVIDLEGGARVYRGGGIQSHQ